MSAFSVVPRLLPPLVALLSLFVLTGCEDDTGSRQFPPNIISCEDAPVTGADVERSARCELVDTEGWDPASSIPTRQALLGKVRGDTRPFAGPEARCGQDDYILQNQHLRVCISGDSSNQLWFTGGNIVDIEQPNNPGHEFIESAGTVLGLSELTGDNIEILNDGSTGDTAVLRVIGIDLMLKFEVGILGSFLGLSTPVGVEVETEYRLAPDSETLEVVTWFTPEVGMSFAEASRLGGELLAPGVTADLFTLPNGLGRPEVDTPFDMFAAITDDASYGIYFDRALNGRSPTGSSTINVLDLFDSSLLVIEGADVPLLEGNEVTYRRWYAAGGPNTTDIQNAFQALPQFARTEEARFDVTLTADNEVAGDARWIVESNSSDDTDGITPRTVVGIVSLTEGVGSISLPVGNYRTRAIHWPTNDLDDVEFEVTGETSVALPAPNSGYIVAEITDSAGQPIPAKLRLSGEQTFDHYDIGRGERFAVQAGTWDVELSLGEEYSVEVVEDVVVSKGDVTTLSVTLERMLDTTSWVSGDFHQHANRSFDSRVAAEMRALANYTAGLDFFAPSEHDMIEDFKGVVAGMGLANDMYVFQGEEVTSFTRHINAFPMPYVHSEAAGGAVATAVRVVGRDPREVRQLSTPEMIQEARRRGAELIQLNHARGDLPYLDDVAYDPVSGEPQANQDQWIEKFEVLEVYNHFPSVCELIRDWSSFLRRGIPVTAVGNSDTHDLVAPSGWPRNYLFIGSDEQEDISDDVLVEAMKAGRVTVSGGLFIDFTDGTRPGDTVVVEDGAYNARLRIQSPSWASADVLITFVNGIEVSRVNLDSNAEDIVDFDEAVSIPLIQDSFVFFLAFDNDEMTQVTPGMTAFGMTNAVYVDVGGDGYEPPGVSGPADVPFATGLPWCGE